MKKMMWLLFCIILSYTACNSNSESGPVANDTTQKGKADTLTHNPAVPGAQNSDDPDRFSQ